MRTPFLLYDGFVCISGFFRNNSLYVQGIKKHNLIPKTYRSRAAAWNALVLVFLWLMLRRRLPPRSMLSRCDISV